MWGLLLLSIAVVYFAIVGLLLYKVKPYWGKALVLIAAILIPNADDWYYRHQLADYCKNEAGYKVYEQVSPKEGLVFPTGLYMDDPLKYVPISFAEWKDSRASVSRYLRMDRLPDGGISKPHEISQYSAGYEAQRLEQRNGIFTEIKQQIVRRDQRTVVGEFQTKFYYGGWYPRALVGGGLDAGCGKNGQVLSRKQWNQDKRDSKTPETNQRLDASEHSFNQIIRQIFSKEKLFREHKMTTPTTLQIRDYAWMSQAAYLDLQQVATGSLATRLQSDIFYEDSRFTQAQADTFTNSTTGYSLVSQQPAQASGFSATLFKGKAGGYTIAVRGTDPKNQLIEDLVNADILGAREPRGQVLPFA